MIKKTILLLILALMFQDLSVFAQKRERAEESILRLKSGALLVKLKTSENLINGLIRRGSSEEAARVKAEQAIINKEIVEEFTKHFQFCKVYFFYSDNSTKVSKGELAGVLLNGQMQIDSSFTSGYFLVGEFGQSGTTKIEGFIIENKNMEQMKSPFPFLIRQNKNGVFRRTNEEMAIAVNSELQNFYEKSK